MPVAWDEFEAVETPESKTDWSAFEPVDSAIKWDEFEPVSTTEIPLTPETFRRKQAAQEISGPPLGSEIPVSEDTGLISAVASDPVGFVKSIPNIAMSVAAAPGSLAFNAAADVVSKVAGQPEYGGNLAAMKTGVERLPVEKFISKVAETNPRLATTANVAKVLPELASMMVVNPSGAVGRLVALGFSADMIYHAKPLFEEYAAEKNLPNPDAGKLSELEAGIIQTFAFAPLAGAHGVGKVPGEIGYALDTARRMSPREAVKPTEVATAEAPLTEAKAPETLKDLPSADELVAATPEQMLEWKKRVNLGESTINSLVESITDAPKLAAELERTIALSKSKLAEYEKGGVQDEAKMAEINNANLKAHVLSETINRGAELGKPEYVKVVADRLVPALRPEGMEMVIGKRGQRHIDILNEKTGLGKQMLIIATGEKGRVFWDGKKLLTREQAQKMLGEKDPLQAERLSELQSKQSSVKAPKEGISIPKDKLGNYNGRLVLKDATGNLFTIKDTRGAHYDIVDAFPEKQDFVSGGFIKDGQYVEGSDFFKPSSVNAPGPGGPATAAGNVGEQSALPAATPVDIISRLESLKFKESDVGLLEAGESLSAGLNLPHPEVLKAIGKDVWNKAIDVAIAGVKAGKEIKLAVEDALAHLKTNATGKFDEAQARANLESIFPKTETSGENVKMRKLSERGTTSETIPEPVQEQISASPESYYRQQSLSAVEDRVRDLSEAELAAVPKESDIYTAAKLEQATRLFNEGKSEQGYRVFQDLSAELTRMGQVINQAKLFQALRPEHVVEVVNKELVKAGRDPLTLEQATRIKDAAKKRIDAQAELNKATKEWQKNPTDENAAKAEKALTDENKAALEEQKLVNQFKPRTTAALIKSILQGNLLTPISQVANLVGNVNFMPFRSATRAGATAIDMLDSAIRNRPRQVSESLAGAKDSVKGLVKGLKQVPGILTRGTGDIIKGESRAGLHPLRAWVKQFAKNPDVPTIGGKIPFSERVNLAIEGTFGVPAEIMLRGLGAGDIGFTEMARGRLISEQARLKKLPANKAKLAQKFPELFFDRKTLELINNETRGAVFQRHSKTLDHFLSWIKGRGDLFDLAVAFVAPYKLTPWNIVGEILSYNPLIAIGRSALEAKRGNIRAAEMNASKAVIGSMLVYAGYWLYEKGLMAPSMDSRDEQTKARILAGEVLPPNHINISGLKRAMSGGDPAFKAGDETVDVFRGGGLAGSMFYMMANIGRDSETKPEADNAIMSVLKNSTIEQARFGLNQSFLKGVTGLLDAVREGEADNYVQSVANTVLSIPLPNTLSVISRAQRTYKVDTKNIVRTRLGFAGLDDYLPLKRGLWGEPMLETPQDRNALVYHFFDISKNRQVTSDPVPLELYRLWRKTANTSVIPTPPAKTITLAGQTYLMKPEQRSRLTELVGTQRREMVDKVVVNPEWYKIPDEQKIKMLDWIYDSGLEIGKAKFISETSLDQLQKKPEKAGKK